MAFQLRLGFLDEQNQNEFTERLLPKLPGCHLVEEKDPAEGEEPEPGHKREAGVVDAEGEPETDRDTAFSHWIRLSVSSPTMARELCHQLQAFLTHHKQSAVALEWTGGDGSAQTAQIGSQQRDAEVAAVRLSASVKAHNDAEKAAARGTGQG